MTLVPLRDSAAVVDVLVSDTSISSLQRRSGGMMTTSDSGRGRGASSGSGGGPATTPNSTSDGKSHGVLVNVVVPVVFVIAVVAFGLAFLRCLLRRMRRSRGRGAWSLFRESEQRPQLFEVCMMSMREKGRDGSWGTLQPASVDLISSEERRRWKRSGHVDIGDVSTAVGSRRVQGKKLHGEHRDFMAGDSSGKDAVEVRVVVLVAMPSPSHSLQMRFSDAAAAPPGPLEEGLFIGTARASF